MADTSIPHSECVAQAVVGMLKQTCGIDLAEIPDDNAADSHIIIAVVSIIGDVEWAVFLGLPKSTAEALAAKFAGFDIPYDSSDMGDAIGELANIVVGNVKALLDRKGVNANISLPSVIRADNLQVLVQSGATRMRSCFDSPLGKLWAGLSAGKARGIML